MGILKNLGNNPDNVIAAVTELFVPQEYASKQMSYGVLRCGRRGHCPTARPAL